MREQRMEMTERRPLLSRITQGYWLRRRMYLIIIFIYLINRRSHSWLTATNFTKRRLPYGYAGNGDKCHIFQEIEFT